jgi:hypothetical protein
MENKAKILSLVTVCSFLISGFASCVSNLVNLSTKKKARFLTVKMNPFLLVEFCWL